MMFTNMIAPNILLHPAFGKQLTTERIERNDLSEAVLATSNDKAIKNSIPSFKLTFLPSSDSSGLIQNSVGDQRQNEQQTDQSGMGLLVLGNTPSVIHQNLVKMDRNNGQNIITMHTKPVNIGMTSDALQVQALLPNNETAAVNNTQKSSTNTLPITQSPSVNTSVVVDSGEWAAIKVNTHSGRWGDQMMQVLQDRVTLQAQQNIQEAKIRLDPPDLGKLEILVRVEGDRLNVQLNANMATTREALAQISERLRVELQEQHFVHVNVNVGSESGKDSSSRSYSDEEVAVATNHQPTLTNKDSFLYHSEHWLNTHA